MPEDSEKEVKITYETLYEILRREKNKDELQKLDESFFRDVLRYLQEKIKMIQDAAGKFDMFSVEERDNTQMQLNNVKRILKELYSKREKKIIDMAINKSRTNSSIIDTSNLLAKEHEMYNSLIRILDEFRKDILFQLLEMKEPVIAETKDLPETLPEQDLNPDSAVQALDKVKVMFLQRVEQFVDTELELYGPFDPETTAELPKDIADILINKGSAVII